MTKKAAQPKVSKKTVCPVSRKDFKQIAPSLVLDVSDDGGQRTVAKFIAAPKEFSTGSFGWGINEKMVLTIGGKPVKVQATINLTVVGSKDTE